MPSYILTLYVTLAFSFGIIVGGRMGIEETKKAYGTRHELLFTRK